MSRRAARANTLEDEGHTVKGVRQRLGTWIDWGAETTAMQTARAASAAPARHPQRGNGVQSVVT